MKVVRIATVALATGVMVLSVASPLAAWHPKGTIKKEVQNQTTSGALSDANSAATAVAAKPGDTLKYVITVSNTGEPASNGHNDMAKTVMTDTLPAGVELASNAAQRQITENLGTLKPGQSVKKEYSVKVTSDKNGAVIENKACFTGDSTANDNPQKGCDVANVKVHVPAKPATPTTPTTPATPPQTPTPTEPQVLSSKTDEPAPAVLPETGPEALIGGAVSLSALAYGANAYLRSKRDLASALKR